MLPVLAGMAALGLAKGVMDQKKEAADRRQAAEMARWSPWSGMQPNQIRQADVLGSTLQGGMTGAMLGSSLDANAAAQAQGPGGAALTTDPAAQASLTGGQSGAMGASAGGYSSTNQFNQGMAQKYPWLGMSTGM